MPTCLQGLREENNRNRTKRDEQFISFVLLHQALGSITSRCSRNEPVLLSVLLGEGRPDTRERRKSSLTKPRSQIGIMTPIIWGTVQLSGYIK